MSKGNIFNVFVWFSLAVFSNHCHASLNSQQPLISGGLQGTTEQFESIPLETGSNEIQFASVLRDETQESSSSSSSSDCSLELEQLFTVSRHGASTYSWFIYHGEYRAYKLKNEDNDWEQLTALGKAQCWATGRNLALTHSDFISQAVENDSYEFNTIKSDKNKLCADYIWFGIQGYVPFIGLFSDSIVQEAMMRHGNCHDCSDGSQFPYEASQSLDSSTTNTDYLTTNFEIHPENFLNHGDNCIKIKIVSVYSDVDPLPLEDVAILKRSSKYLKKVGVDAFDVLRTISKHLYHGIPLEHGLENLTKGTIKRALSLKDDWQAGSFKFLNIHFNNWVSTALNGRPIIRDIIKKIQSQEKAFNLYATHDVNLASLLMFLHGAKNGIESMIPYYASTLEIRVYYKQKTDEKIVKLFFNGKDYTIRDCDAPCYYDTFIEQLEVYTELGGDLKEFCSP
jgi:hypothetical protein